MKPTLGRTVLYKFSQADADAGHGRAGDECPAVVCRVHGETCVNLRLLPDSDRTPRVTSVYLGTSPGTWSWPVLEKSDGIATSPKPAAAKPAPAPESAPSPGVVATTETAPTTK